MESIIKIIGINRCRTCNIVTVKIDGICRKYNIPKCWETETEMINYIKEWCL